MIIRKQNLLASTNEQIRRKEQIIRQTRGEKRKERYLSVLEETEEKFMRDFFGGMDETLFPCTAACLRDTAVRARESGLAGITADDFESGWSDGIYLKSIEKEGEIYRITAGATAVNPVWEMAMSVDFYTVEDGVTDKNVSVIREGTPSFIFPCEHNVNAELTVEKSLTGEGVSGLFFTVCLIGQNDVMRFKTKTVEFSSFADDFDMISLITVDAPVKKGNAGAVYDPVVVCYDRVPSLTERYDYLIYFQEEGGFYLPTKGRAVFFDKNMRFDKVLNIGEGSSSCLMLIREEGGSVCFQNDFDKKSFPEFFSIYIDPETKLPGFQWDFGTTRWQNKNPLPVMELLKMDYYLAVSYQVKGSGDVYHMRICSGEYPVGGRERLPGIELYWGCLYRDTPVMMADRFERKIQEIRQGDLVFSDNGPLRVRDVITGQERKGIYRLTAGRADGERLTLCLTGEHPVITQEGPRILLHIRPYINEQGETVYREQVRTADGSYASVLALELTLPDDSSVYNLELEAADGGDIPTEEAVFYAGGMAVGDHQMQAQASRMEKQRERNRHGLDRRWQTDVQTIARYFNLRKKEQILWKN